ncbi:MAG TPA: Gfo/Idh/MocA family oxidoreductase [Methylomirabilota bacterium]|jgi:predicted dehydrogenase|nr:Gfo/Idh/MocA family oxidoreductase [Methylomirabilota bacterium]
MAPLHMLVWGSGFFGRKWLEAIKNRPDCVVAGIVSRAPGRLDGLRRDLDLPDVPGSASLDEALARGPADAVVVALPEMLHRDAIVQALGAGLHVLTEKPLAMTMAEARAIVEAARARRDRVVMVTQNFRWRPHTRALRRAIADELVGRPEHLMLECRQQIRRTTVDAWREQMADPFLLDFAIHHMDLIRYLTGDEAREVVGVTLRPSWSWFAGDAAAAAILTMASGLVVDYGGTMVAQGGETPQEGLITVLGARGTLHLDARSEVRVLGQGEPRALPPEPVPDGELGHGLAQFVDAVRTGRRPETHLEDNVRTLALLLAVQESARTGRTVRPADLMSFL